MRLREFTIRLLLRTYPAAWRREFGAEFEDLLRQSPLTIPVIANVISGGFGQHIADFVRRIAGGGEMADRTFSARYDLLTKIVSVVAVVLLITMPVMALRAGSAAALAALVAVAAIGLSFAFSPRGYEISNGEFRIKRLIGDVVIPLGRLRFIRYATAADFWGCIRLWGSGGLFGYYGWFWSKALGRSRWYVTDRNKAVIVTDGDRTILVSPEDREAFVASIQRADSATLPAHLQESRSSKASLAIGLSIGASVLALVAAAMLYSPGRPPLDLSRDSLAIHSRFYGMTVPASSVDAANVRVVDLRAEPGWKPVLRTNGFANPHYRAGNFRTASGKAVKLFTTGAQRLVLLPPSSEDGTPVLLDTADPDEFAARVRAEWAGR